MGIDLVHMIIRPMEGKLYQSDGHSIVTKIFGNFGLFFVQKRPALKEIKMVNSNKKILITIGSILFVKI